MSTADLLYHQYKIEDKIRRQYKRLRDLRRDASHCMRRRRRELTHQLEGRDISGGVARTRNIYDIQRAIARHGTLLEEIKRQMKAKFKLHKDKSTAVYVNPEKQDWVALLAKLRVTTPPKVTQGCRHHTRKRRPVTDEKEVPTQLHFS